jgi:xanthine/uracil/vitamin C permease (AzgA family)
MKTLLFISKPARRSVLQSAPRRFRLALSCGIATCLVATGTRAQVLTLDNTSNATSLAGFAKQLAQTVQRRALGQIRRYFRAPCR